MEDNDLDTEVLDALDAVITSLDECAAHIETAKARARQLRSGRRNGEPYAAIVASAEGPLVIESTNAILAALSDSGARLRRSLAQALYSEGLSMEKVAKMFGVTRQRVSSLLSDSGDGERQAGSAVPTSRVGGLALTDPEFRMLADSIPFPVWVSLPDGYTEYFNTVGTDYTGCPREANYDWNWVSLIHPDDAEGARLKWQQACENETLFSTTYRIRRGDGEYRWHWCRAAPIRGIDGNVTKWIGIAVDVDEAKRLPEAG